MKPRDFIVLGSLLLLPPMSTGGMNFYFLSQKRGEKNFKNFYGNGVSGVVEFLFPTLFWREPGSLLPYDVRLSFESFSRVKEPRLP